MVRLAISVEGSTEYEFCREVLRPYFQALGIYADAKMVVTKRNISGPNAKGGAVSLERFAREVKPLLHTFDYVTTLYDLYGFRGRLPGETVESLCRRMASFLGDPRNLIPYVQQYEFEALLLASPEIIGRYLACSSLEIELLEAVQHCGGAEDVNDHPETAPSKRIEEAFQRCLGQRYDKKFHGPLLVMEIGLPTIRTACPRFNGWITCLESLASELG
jgi:hypothetical protein